MRTKPKIEIDLKKVEEYAQFCDNEEEIALALGISVSTLNNRKKESEEFRAAIKRGKAKANVFVGGKLMQKIKDGDTASTIFYLKSRCGWRETNRTEITGLGGRAIEMKAQIDDLRSLTTAELMEIARMKVDDESGNKGADSGSTEGA